MGETPIEVAEEEETRRLLLEGIPIFKDFEKRRKNERERMKEEEREKREKSRKLFEETLDAEDKIPASRLSSDFDSEDDLPISQLKSDNPVKITRLSVIASEDSKSIETNVVVASGSPDKTPSSSDNNSMTISSTKDANQREEKPKKEKKKDKNPDNVSEESIEERKRKKMKKNRSKDEEKHTKHTKKEEIVDSRSKEEKERDRVELWKLEIERKINLEAQEKGIKLTKEQL